MLFVNTVRKTEDIILHVLRPVGSSLLIPNAWSLLLLFLLFLFVLVQADPSFYFYRNSHYYNR